MDGDAGPSRHSSPRFVPHAISSRYCTHQNAPANAGRPRNYVAHSMLEGWFGKGKAASSTTAESEPASSPSSAPPVTPPPEQPGPSTEALAEAAAWQDHAETDEERRQRERVEGWRDDLFRTSPMLRFMARHLSLVSCDPFADNGNGTGTSRLEITACPPNIAGGFSPNNEKASQSGILICSNRIMDKGHLEDTLAHEMVHWWDHCRFRVDWSNLRHHACSEVRAAALSGDCKLGREWTRRNFGGFTKQHQVCARRRAVLSVMANPACKGGQEEAEKVVDEVFPQCFADTRPFDEIY